VTEESKEEAMEIVVRARNIGWNDELRQQVERSIAFAVDRHSGRIDRISVSVIDLNGPRGGVDKLCRITAHLRGSRPVSIMERGDDLMAIVNQAARRLGYRVGKKLHRQCTPGAREYRTTIRVA
jgi:putative sigma-54 modulation protein